MEPINYEELEPGVVPLCRALNSLPGVETESSCDGHGKYGCWVRFYCVDETSLALLRSLLPKSSGRFNPRAWHLTHEPRVFPEKYRKKLEKHFNLSENYWCLGCPADEVNLLSDKIISGRI